MTVRHQTERPEQRCLFEPEVKLAGHQQSLGQGVQDRLKINLFRILSLLCVTFCDPETRNPDSQLTHTRACAMIKGRTLKRGMHNPAPHTRSHKTRSKLQRARSRANELLCASERQSDVRGCVFMPPKRSVIKEIFIMAQRPIRSATSSKEQQVQIKKHHRGKRFFFYLASS